MPFTPDQIEAKLKPFYETDDALQVAVAMVNAITSTEQVLLGETGREVAVASGRFLTDFAFGLMGNKFWQLNAGHIVPVLATAVMARMDSYKHAQARAQDPAQGVAHISARQAVAEVAVQVLFCEQGTSGAVASSGDLRRMMIKEFGGLSDAG